MGKVTQFKVKPGYLGGTAQVMKAYSEFKAPDVGAELRNSWQESLSCEVRIYKVLRALCAQAYSAVH